jgi:hypothetical protein
MTYDECRIKEIVTQTQVVMEESINDEHRILRMRAHPKILVADNYEEELALYRLYRLYLLSVLSDVRFPKNGQIHDKAVFSLLSMARREKFNGRDYCLNYPKKKSPQPKVQGR